MEGGPEPVFESPYTDTDKRRILSCVVWKPEIDQEKLFRQLELGAIRCWCLRGAHDQRPDRPASKQIEYWEPVASSLRDARRRLEQVLADPHLYLEIETALASRPTRSGSRSSTAVPRFDPPARHVWTPPPIEGPTGVPVLENIPETFRDTLVKGRDGIAQAEALIEHTVLFASQEKTSRTKQHAEPGQKAAGRTADQPLYDFVKIIGKRYAENAAGPGSATVDPSNENGSELVRLLDACLRPIGLPYDGPSGVVALWHRVKSTMPPSWPFHE